MKRFKGEKGITLVALIITIVVLLILAVVSIGAVQDSDIIGHAQDAAGGYGKAKDNEIDILKENEKEIEKYVPKEEYIGNLRLNKEYLFAGKDDNMSVKFYSDGTATMIDSTGSTTVQYSVEGDIIKGQGMEAKVIKEEKNDILIYDIVTESGVEPRLFATSTEGLKFFDGEKYVSEEAYMTDIILKNNEVEENSLNHRALHDTIPVFYKGDFYNFTIYISDTEESKVTSIDNCETLNVNGIIYTKVTE